VKDNLLRRALKGVALWNFKVNLWVTRRAQGPAPYTLGGDCRLCAACCEAPSLQVSAVVWFVPMLRRTFLAWQRHVNQWERVRDDAEGRVFVFKCHHFDVSTRRCDSYDSRPGVCRDYPRALLAQPAPEMLPGCGYRPVARNAAVFLRVLDGQAMTPEQRDRLRRELHLEDAPGPAPPRAYTPEPGRSGLPGGDP
jgi:uncharacterized protein